jgi:AmmeMemoRadiSam system protein A
MKISSEEKKIMLQIAHNAIASLYDKNISDNIDYAKYPILQTHKGVFVTLTKNKALRGCIGYIISNLPLYQTIQDSAKQAAIGDPRFPKLTREEFEKTAIEISILSEPFPMKSYDEIIIGKHGLILTEQGRRGLLLPQVPIEHNMTKEEYLSALCQKAGFHPNLWRERVLDIEMFTADVFSEEEIEDDK